MRTTYDSEYDILYINIAEDRGVRETQPLNDDVFVDFDEEGRIVGIEIWRASKNIVEPVAERLIENVRAALGVIVK
jgi:uncharacterized protein YuzE